MNNIPIFKESPKISTSKTILFFLSGLLVSGSVVGIYHALKTPNSNKNIETVTKIEKNESIYVNKDELLSSEELAKIHYVARDSIKLASISKNKDLTKKVVKYLTTPKINIQNDKGLWNQIKTQEGIITKGVLILGDQRYTFSIREFYEKNNRLAISQRLDGTQSKKDLKTYIDEGLDGLVDKTDYEDVSKTQEIYDEFKTRAIKHYEN